jgi:hypothetical protein
MRRVGLPLSPAQRPYAQRTRTGTAKKLAELPGQHGVLAVVGVPNLRLHT